MQTVYYTVKRSAPLPDNVVDFQSFRRKQQRSAALPAVPCETENPLDYPSRERGKRPATRLEQVGQVLDSVASVALAFSAVLALAALL